MGQAAVIKINSQDFSRLRQGHTLPSGEKAKQKLKDVGMHGWAKANREICKEVRCHRILINLHLRGLAQQSHTSVCGGSVWMYICPWACHLDVCFVLARQFLFTACSPMYQCSLRNAIQVLLGVNKTIYSNFFFLFKIGFVFVPLLLCPALQAVRWLY